MSDAAPLAIDLFCGLGGWTEGLIAEGYRVVGFDNMQHVYGEARYPALPIVWGGYFPTLYPGPVLDAPYVDWIVRGQGERTFVELLDVLEGRSDPAAVAGPHCRAPSPGPSPWAAG